MKLYRKLDGSIIGGVCSGIADAINMDVILVRVIAVVLLFFTAGIAGIVYLFFWALIPAQDGNTTIKEEAKGKIDEVKEGKSKFTKNQLIGGLLIIGGALVFLSFLYPFNLLYRIFLPVALVGIGIYFLLRKK